MTHIFRADPSLSAADVRAARCLLDTMLAGGSIGNHPVYHPFRLPESGIHITLKWVVGADDSVDEVSLLTLSEGKILTLASLKRTPAENKTPSVWPTVIYWSLFLVSWLIIIVALIKR